MEEYRLLRSHYLDWHQARLNLLSLFILGLIKARTVNLSLVSEHFCGYVQSESHYKRIQHFLAFFTIDFDQIALLIAKWMLPDEK